MPACPPGASRSTTIVLAPLKPHTPPQPFRRARRRRSPCRTRRRPARWRARASRPPGGVAVARRSCRRRPESPANLPQPATDRPTARPHRAIRRNRPERDLVAVQEASEPCASGIPPMPDQDRTRRRRLGGKALEPGRSTDPVRCEPANLPCDVRRRGCNGVVILGLDPHHTRVLRSAKPNRKHRAQRNRHLPENVPRIADADDTLDPVSELGRLDATIEHGEERSLASLRRCVFAGKEADVGRSLGKPLELFRAEPRRS